MKKIYFSITLAALALNAVAQSQRLVLIEEFTQASCGPCANANPAFNTLLNNNTSKAISIKYQVNWPGVDPMNAQYPAPVSARVNYYAVNSVPYAIMDGDAVSGPNYTGYPGNCTQSMINGEYALPSPFTVNVSHTLNAAQDSIFITAAITATQNFTGVNYLRAHIVLIEKHIHFTTAPGSNGETDFYNVCRKMYPHQAGTGLPLTWTSGDDSVINIKAAIPSYIYDVNQLAVVAFVQDNGNKQVLQAGYSNSPVGIYTYTNAPSAITLFPNPARDRITVAFTLPDAGDAMINIYNLDGQLILTEKRERLIAGRHELMLDIALPDGIYLAELITADARTTGRVVVSH